jgi:hypothetical protein
MSPGRHSGTTVWNVGGSAGAPSAVTSLKVSVLAVRSSFPGPDGVPRITPLLVGLYRPEIQPARAVPRHKEDVRQDPEHEHEDEQRPERVRLEETHGFHFSRLAYPRLAARPAAPGSPNVPANGVKSPRH